VNGIPNGLSQSPASARSGKNAAKQPVEGHYVHDTTAGGLGMPHSVPIWNSAQLLQMQALKQLRDSSRSRPLWYRLHFLCLFYFQSTMMYHVCGLPIRS
jgi:hypothetical protein